MSVSIYMCVCVHSCTQARDTARDHGRGSLEHHRHARSSLLSQLQETLTGDKTVVRRNVPQYRRVRVGADCSWVGLLGLGWACGGPLLT